MAPAQAGPKSSSLETSNDGDRLCCPGNVGWFGCEDLHLRPVIRELATAIKANHVCPRYRRCCSAASHSAAHGDREAAPFVPTTEDQIEQTHKPPRLKQRSMPTAEAFARLQARTRFRLLNGYLGSRTGCVKRARVPSTNRLHQARTLPGR